MIFHLRVALILLFGGAFLYASSRLFLSWWEITHGYSKTPANQWVLVGGVTSTTAEFRIHIDDHDESDRDAQLLVSEDANFREPQVVVSLTANITRIAGVYSVTVRELLPQTRYHYGVVLGSTDKELLITLQGTFHTPAPAGTRYNFTIALAGCARTGSQHRVFDAIRKEDNLQLFIHMGDFHYFDYSGTSLQRRIDAVSTVLNAPPQAALYRSTALSYMWDDHDLYGNNAFTPENDLIREVALQSYRVAFPHHPLTAPDQTPYQAFTMGTVRILLADARSEANETTEIVFSDSQREWFQAELAQASEYDFLIWVNTKPWVGEAYSRSDSWFAAPEQRQTLSDYVSSVVGGPDGPQNLLMVSADAHMLAFDDGTNTYYGTDNNTAMSFPLLHSGPLDRTGSAKGGPYSEGCTAFKYKQNHQYSTISFEAPTNDQQEACLVIHGYRILHSGKNTVITKRLCGKIFHPSHRDIRQGTCSIDRKSGNNDPLLWVSMTSGCIAGALLLGCHPYFRRTWMAKEGPIAIWVVLALWTNQKSDESPITNTALAVSIGIGILLVMGSSLVWRRYRRSRVDFRTCKANEADCEEEIMSSTQDFESDHEERCDRKSSPPDP